MTAKLKPITAETAVHLQELSRFTHGWITDVAWSEDIVTLGISSANGVFLYDMRKPGIPPHHLTGHTEPVRALAISADSHWLASGGDAGVIRLWDMRHQEEKAVYQQHMSAVTGLAFHPRQPLLASTQNATVALWNTDSGVLQTTLDGHLMEVTRIRFSPDGKLLASGGKDATVRLWDVQHKTCQQILHGASDRINEVAFSDDSRFLAAGSRDGYIRVWDLQHNQEIVHQYAHLNGVDCVGFSPDDSLLVSGGRDRQFKIWTVPGGKQIAAIDSHRKPVLRLTFNRIGVALVTASGDNTVRVWGVPL